MLPTHSSSGRENSLSETGIIRLRAFGECMFYSFLKCDEMSWFYLFSIAAGLYQGRQPSRCPPCPSVGTRRAGGAAGHQGLSSASLPGLLLHLLLAKPAPNELLVSIDVRDSGAVVETGELGT